MMAGQGSGVGVAASLSQKILEREKRKMRIAEQHGLGEVFFRCFLLQAKILGLLVILTFVVIYISREQILEAAKDIISSNETSSRTCENIFEREANKIN